MLAEAKEWWMMFSIWWHEAPPWLDQQLRLWRPNSSTSFPQETQVCGRHMGAPTLKPMAVCTASLDMQRPSEEMGGAFSHAPDSLELAPSRRDRETWSVQPAERVSSWCWTIGWSHDFCRFVVAGTATPTGKALFQVEKAQSLSWYGTDDNWGGRSYHIRSEAPSVDAKKADGARLEAIRNQRPPEPTGKVACNQDGSSRAKLMLVILETMTIIRWSQDPRRGEEKAGQVRRMCWSLGMENELRRMVMASCICR